MWGGASGLAPSFQIGKGIMKYTVLDADRGTPFIQQVYDKQEDAQARLDALKEKFGDRYNLVIGSSETETKKQNAPGKKETS
jgi:hypothetical protein